MDRAEVVEGWELGSGGGGGGRGGGGGMHEYAMGYTNFLIHPYRVVKMHRMP